MGLFRPVVLLKPVFVRAGGGKRGSLDGVLSGGPYDRLELDVPGLLYGAGLPG